MFTIQEILFFILVAVAIVVGALLLYNKYIAPMIGKPVPDDILTKARAIALDVVCYIEQTLSGEMPKDKKLQARDRLKRLLGEINIKLSDETIDLMIEAAVFIMNTEILGKTEKYSAGVQQ